MAGVPVWESLAIIDYLDDITGGVRFWPADKAARALARSMAAEMHAGYGPLRSRHCMHLRLVWPPTTPDADVQADIDRIMALWAQTRTGFSTGQGGGGDFLFGAFGAADIMFAPVVTRFQSYGLPVTPLGRDYMDAILAHPFMAQWYGDAAREDWVIPRFEPADPE